jgi:peptidoglycan hydrolase CwlO-like protein
MTPKRILGSLIAVVFILMLVFVKKSQKELKLDLIKYDSAINNAKIEIKSLEKESKEIEKQVLSKEYSIKEIYIQYEKDTTYVNSMSIDSIQSWFTDRYK